MFLFWFTWGFVCSFLRKDVRDNCIRYPGSSGGQKGQLSPGRTDPSASWLHGKNKCLRSSQSENRKISHPLSKSPTVFEDPHLRRFAQNKEQPSIFDLRSPRTKPSLCNLRFSGRKNAEPSAYFKSSSCGPRNGSEDRSENKNKGAFLRFSSFEQRRTPPLRDQAFCSEHLSNPKPRHTMGRSGRGGARRDVEAKRGRAGRDADGSVNPEDNHPSSTSGHRKTIVLNVSSESRTNEILCTCRTQNPDIPRVGRDGAAHGGAARRGGARQDWVPTVGSPRIQPSLLHPRASRTTVLNVSSKAQTNFFVKRGRNKTRG